MAITLSDLAKVSFSKIQLATSESAKPTSVYKEHQVVMNQSYKACQHCSYKATVTYSYCLGCTRPYIKSRTQKGKGIQALQDSVSNSLGLIGIIQNQTQITTGIQYPVFARPAPSLPRHGYIDSRVVKSEQDLRNLLDEVLADDPNGEILLCPFITSYCSAIWTPGSLAVGKGHDGATAGKRAFNIPLATGSIATGLTKSAGIKPDQWPYVEVVFNEESLQPTYVQLRAGPQLAGITGNYIPAPMVVTKVLHADPRKYADLGWEQEIERNTGKDGVVVWHPDGTITDHFSIHAFAAKLPILFDKTEPTVGTLLTPTKSLGTFDPKAMLEGVVLGDMVRLPLGSTTDLLKYATAAFTALHHATAMTGEHSKWLGVSAAILLKMGTAALMGEARHLGGASQQTREDVYEQTEKKSLTALRARVNALVNIFRYGQWNGSFGGMKWACCGAATVELFNAVHRLATEQTEESAAKLVMALNLVVNQAHNGGWWLNKFCQQELFNEVQRGHFTYIVPGAPAFYEYHERYLKTSAEEFQKRADRISEWGAAQLNPPRVQSASLLHFPSLKTLEISVATKLLKGHGKKITANISSIGETKTSEIKNHLYLVEGEDGYRLEYRKTDPVILWQDKPLKDEAAKMAKKALKQG